MKGEIKVVFDNQTGQVMLYAPLQTPDERILTANVLASAIPIALNHRPSALINPNATKPPTPLDIQ